MSIRTAADARGPWARRLISAPLEFGRDWLVRFVSLQGFDRAVALGGQAFTALIPMLIVYAAIVSPTTGRDFADQLIKIFGLSGNSAEAMRQVFAPASEIEGEVNALGAVILVGAALSFTRALQRLYQLAFDQPSLGWRATKWGLIWLAFAAAITTIRPAVLSPFHGLTLLVLTIGAATLLWVVTPYLLLGRRLPWRRLMPVALLTAVGMTGMAVCSAIWMPRSVETSAEQFGTIGVAFAMLSWLIGAGVVLVLAAAGGALIDHRLGGEHEAPHPGG